MRQECTRIQTDRWGLVLLAPTAAVVPDELGSHATLPDVHEDFLAGLQRLRGRIYLEDGAIESWQLTPDGRHRSDADDRSWHLLAVDGDGGVVGCARYQPYPNTVRFAQLWTSRAALARSCEWGRRLEEAVEEEVGEARRRRIAFGEVGGWALSEALRCSAAALKIALASYSLARILGDCVSIGTATERHGSASMLRRIGGTPLKSGGVELPAYFDPQYRCNMQVLRFDSQRPHPRYEAAVQEIRAQLLRTPVISRTSSLHRLGMALDSAQRLVGQPGPSRPALGLAPDEVPVARRLNY